MKKFRYQSRRLRVRLRARWMTCRLAAAEKRRGTHENIPSSLKEMWRTYLSFAGLDF